MIVLFSDFGFQGPYTGQMKAVLHQMVPGMPAIDLFADAPVGNPKASAYLLADYAEWFRCDAANPSQSVWGGPSSSLSLAVNAAIRNSASARLRFDLNASSS